MKTIKQKVKFKASPNEIYEMLMDSKKHSGFTGSKAKISREVGGKISAYDGWIEGKNLVLKQDKKIVQRWRGKDWPKEHYSKAIFALRKDKKEGTALDFTQTNVPEKYYKLIKDGWKEHYWQKMKKFLRER